MSHAEISPWFADITNYLAAGIIPSKLTFQQKKRFFVEVKQYFWDDPILFKQCADRIILRCMSESEMGEILKHCHSLECGGHFNGQRIAAKVLQSGFYWPSLFKDSHSFVKSCDRCQRIGNIGRRNEMPLTNILEVKLFDVWGIDFMGHFQSSYGYKYILLVVDYVSKWVEAIPTIACDVKIVLSFIRRNIFSRFGTPRAVISDEGLDFCNKLFASLLAKYGVKHRVSLSYHPQCNGQAEVSKLEIKKMLEKPVNVTRKDWANKIDDNLWAYRTTFKTPLGMSPYKWLSHGSPLVLQHRTNHR